MAPVKKSLFCDLPKNSVVLLLTPPEGYLQASIEVMRQLVEGGDTVIYVAVNKPSVVVLDYLKRAGVKTDSVFFIDCATASVSGESARTKNTLFVSPKNLTGLSLAINELIAELPGSKAVVFDSLDTLGVYNSIPTLEKFSHFIANKIRLGSVSGLLIAASDLNKELLSLMEEVCDKTIRFEV